jgi:DNA modification methylase
VKPAGLLVQADSRRIPLRDQSVHMVATSIPYFGLRDYQTGHWEGGDPECAHRPIDGRGDYTDPMRGLGHVVGAPHRGGNPWRCRCGAVRVDLQIGLEDSLEAFVAAIVSVFGEVWRVLRDDGTVWLNCGDSYAGSWGNQGRTEERGTQRPINGPMLQSVHDGRYPLKGSRTGSISAGSPIKTKELMGVPYRVVFGLQAAGWYWRSAPPWLKGSPMPESVNDRPSTGHETIFLLSKQPDYFYDMVSVRKSMAAASAGRYQYAFGGAKSISLAEADEEGIGVRTRPIGFRDVTDGRNQRTTDWWMESMPIVAAQLRAQADEIDRVARDGGMLTDDDGLPLAFLVNTKPYKGAHFATWPPALVTPMVKAGTSEKGCCPTCKSPWIRITDKRREPTRPAYDSKVQRASSEPDSPYHGHNGTVVGNRDPLRHCTVVSTRGWAPSCECYEADYRRDMPRYDKIRLRNPKRAKKRLALYRRKYAVTKPWIVEPCIVYDPFCGSGTTLEVALGLGRSAIGTDLKYEYLAEFASERVEQGHRPHKAKASHAPASVGLGLLGGEEPS